MSPSTPARDAPAAVVTPIMVQRTVGVERRRVVEREAGGDGEAAGVGAVVVARPRRRTRRGRCSCSDELSAKPGIATAGPVSTARSTVLGALLHAVEVERVAHRVGDLVHALLERLADGGDELGVALDLVERRRRGRRGCSHPRACSIVRPRRSESVCAIASRPPAAARVKRQPVSLATATLVEAGEVDVEHGVLGAGRCAARAPWRRRRGRCPRRARPASLRRGDEAVDHVAADRDDHDARARARRRSRRCRAAGSRARPRPSAPGCGPARWRARPPRARLGRRRARQVERADDDALVGDAEAHARAEVVLGEQRAQLVAERGRVGDLAVTQDARAKLGDRALA